MAITGLVLIVFLIMHMAGNLKMFIGPESFDHYADWLKGLTEDGGILYPILPAGSFIWIFRLVLLACIVAHMYSAWVLTLRDRAARGSNYVVTKRRAQTYSARTMRWGGVIIAAFVVFHLIQFTIIPGSFGGSGDEPHSMVVASFTQWWMVALYAVCMVLICMHIRHGVWSAFTTLGANTSALARKNLNLLAIVVAVVLYVGFMIMPLAVLFRVI